MAATDDRQSWRRVLAAIEADTVRAAALLAGRDDDPAGDDDRGGGTASNSEVQADNTTDDTTDGEGVPDVRKRPDTVAHEGVPAVWRLPAQRDPEPRDLADMPPIPADLGERIRSLRDRIDALQADLAHALQLARTMRADRVPVRTATPGYIDRRL